MPFSASSRVPLLPKARSRVRAASAQRQAARPIWVAHRHVQVPARPGRVQALCDRRLAELLRRADSTNGGPRQPSQALVRPAGLGARGGQLGAGPASLRQRSTAHLLRSRARKALARHLSRARGRWLACVGRRCAEPLHPARPRRGGPRQSTRIVNSDMCEVQVGVDAVDTASGN